MENAYTPISEACVKALSDKTYEKRKIAASEIEKFVLLNHLSYPEFYNLFHFAEW